MAASPTVGIYIAGRDSFGAMWAGIRTAGFSGWQPGGAVATGKPGIAAGADGTAYIAIRDPWNALWMAPFNSAAVWVGWQPGGGVVTTNPELASVGNRVYVAALTSVGGIWYNSFLNGTGNQWQGWVPVSGVLQSITATGGGSLLLAGTDPYGNSLWWFDSTGSGWKLVGYPGLAAGPVVGSPR